MRRRSAGTTERAGLPADDRSPVFVEVRVGATLAEAIQDVVVVLECGRKIAAFADMLLDDLLVKFHTESGRVGHSDEAVVHGERGETGERRGPLGGDLHATKGPNGRVRLDGTVTAVRGTYDFQGRLGFSWPRTARSRPTLAPARQASAIFDANSLMARMASSLPGTMKSI